MAKDQKFDSLTGLRRRSSDLSLQIQPLNGSPSAARRAAPDETLGKSQGKSQVFMAFLGENPWGKWGNHGKMIGRVRQSVEKWWESTV